MSQHRSEEFDEIATGWGGDNLDDLMARVQLLGAYWAAHLPLPPAELKIARAMHNRLRELGGLPPSETMQ